MPKLFFGIELLLRFYIVIRPNRIQWRRQLSTPDQDQAMAHIPQRPDRAEDGVTEIREDGVEAAVEGEVEDKEMPVVDRQEDHEEEEGEADIVKQRPLSCPSLPTSRQKPN